MQELGYTGYERLRRGFDRAFGGQEKVPKFPLVIDAGCGTGLAGEQVSVVLFKALLLSKLCTFLSCSCLCSHRCSVMSFQVPKR